ncbi:hypothetical protein MLD38_026007 [Melastoma candidum]|uniref:Uncharacterized protein n=1 Tax=Melastoma candidum TaxID=119954 RepID=A0ACB9NWX2_9MYRT|nr:hypothetical protein MLD38_026007 [Melastoma candidum]
MTYNSMDVQIHNLEQEAYCAVLRAFKAQSDALSWDKESLITELRNELGVSHDEHRELLSRVNSDDVICRISHVTTQGELLSIAQKAFQLCLIKWLSYWAMYPKIVFEFWNFCLLPLGNGDKVGPSRPMHEVLPSPTFSRKKRKTSGRHALVYDIHTANETWEWVNFKEISPMDIRWEEDLAITHHSSIVGLGHGYKRRSGPGPGPGRGRMMARNKNDYLPMQNGVERKLPDDIELFDTELLVKEVERVFDANQPDPAAVAKAKRLLKCRSMSRLWLMPYQGSGKHLMAKVMDNRHICWGSN